MLLKSVVEIMLLIAAPTKRDRLVLLNRAVARMYTKQEL